MTSKWIITAWGPGSRTIQDHPDSTRFDQLEISRCSCCRLTGLPFGPCLPDGPVIGWTNFTEMVRSSERKPSSQVVAGKRSRINIDDIDIDDIDDIDDINEDWCWLMILMILMILMLSICWVKDSESDVVILPLQPPVVSFKDSTRWIRVSSPMALWQWCNSTSEKKAEKKCSKIRQMMSVVRFSWRFLDD